MDTKIVTLAYDYTDAEGNSYEADQTVELPRSEASVLIGAGRARRPDTDTKASKPAKKRAARKRTAKKAAAPAPGTGDSNPADPANTEGN